MNYETLIADSRLAFVNGQSGKAFELAKEAIKIAPEEAEGYKAAADACMSLENYALAADYYKNAVKCDPKNGNRYFNYGYALAACEKTADALKALTRADELGCSQETTAQLYHLLGIICFDIRKFDDSLINLKKAEQIMGPDIEVLQRMAVIYGLKEDVRNGIFVANQMKLISPSDYTGYKTAFKFLCQIKKYKEAAFELRKASKYAKISMDYYFDLMTYELEMYNQTKDKSYFEKALMHLDESLKNIKPSVKEVAETYINAAEIYLQLEKAEETINCLNASLNPVESFNLGFNIIPKEVESKELTEYDVEEMLEEDRQKIEENLGIDGVMELAESIEPDEEGGRDYFTVLDFENETKEEKEKFRLDPSEKYSFSPELNDQISTLFIGAYTLLKDYENIKTYAQKLQSSKNQYSVYMGKYTYAKALKEQGSDKTESYYDELIRYLKNALLKDPTDFAAVTYRVRCLIDMQRFDEAEELSGLLSKDMGAGLIDEIKRAKSGGEA